MTGIVQTVIDGFSKKTVFRTVGAVIVVKGNGKVLKIGLVFLAGFCNQLFRGNAFGLGTQHNGGAVGIIGTDIVTFMTLHFLKAYPYIGLDIFNKMSQMDRAIGIG